MAESNKSEQATPRHRQKARERGQITRSRELSGALSMCAVAGAMYMMCRQAVPEWAHYFRTTLDIAATDSIEPGGALLFWTTMETLLDCSDPWRRARGFNCRRTGPGRFCLCA